MLAADAFSAFEEVGLDDEKVSCNSYIRPLSINMSQMLHTYLAEVPRVRRCL